MRAYKIIEPLSSRFNSTSAGEGIIVPSVVMFVYGFCIEGPAGCYAGNLSKVSQVCDLCMINVKLQEIGYINHHICMKPKPN
jgi:hypothetical protein